MKRVYMAQRHSDGLVKIGHSDNYHRRLIRLRCENGPMTLLLSEWGNDRVEPIVHGFFGAHRVEGEWFRPHPEVLAFAETPPTLREFLDAWTTVIELREAA